jgi:hypothetical protein
MTKNKLIRLIRKPGILWSALAIVLTSVFASNASAVTVNGIKEGTEYTVNGGSTSSGSISLLWWNDHKTNYSKSAGNMNPLYWEINDGGGSNVSLNLFFEVPTYARRMIWAAGCSYNGGSVSAACTPLAPGNPEDTSFLGAYYAGNHHSDVNMSYGTQTGSEYFRLNDDPTNKNNDTNKDDSVIIKKIKWQDEDDDGLGDNFTWATSREYLIDQNICSTSECLQFDRTSSIEMLWTGLTLTAAKDLRDSVTDMQLHLSDNATGLPPISEVPLPAAFWLFGSALIGFIGFSRRTNVA